MSPAPIPAYKHLFHHYGPSSSPIATTLVPIRSTIINSINSIKSFIESIEAFAYPINKDMAMKDTTKTGIILTTPEDWEPWIKRLQANVDEEIWPHIDPGTDHLPDSAEELLQKPQRPQPTDFNPQAQTYANLEAAQRREYEAARKFYDQDLKLYQRQREALQAARAYISNTISPSKEILLDQSQSVYHWLTILQDDTKPTPSYMRKQAQQLYTEALKGLKLAKINQWLDRWEHAMKIARKYNLSQTTSGEWLQDLADVIRPLSDTYAAQYTKMGDNPRQSNSEGFHKVANELRTEFASRSRRTGPSGTARGFALNAEFAGGSEEDTSTTEGPMGSAETSGNNRKRAGTNSIQTEETSPKKPRGPKCPACDLRSHKLPDCWYLFESKRPKGFKLNQKRLETVHKRMEEDKKLAADIEKLKLEGGDEA